MGSQSLVTGTWSGDLPGNLGRARRRRSAAPRPPGSSASPPGDPTSAATRAPILTADVFVRWAQLGAISPVFEVGGTGVNARPWELGPAAMDGLRKRGHPSPGALPRPLSARPPRAPDRGPRAAPAWSPVPERRACLGRGGGAPRRPRPSRGAGDRTGDDAVRVPPGGRLDRSRDRQSSGRADHVHAPDPSRRAAALPSRAERRCRTTSAHPDVWKLALAAQRSLPCRQRRLAPGTRYDAGNGEARPSTARFTRPRSLTAFESSSHRLAARPRCSWSAAGCRSA